MRDYSIVVCDVVVVGVFDNHVVKFIANASDVRNRLVERNVISVSANKASGVVCIARLNINCTVFERSAVVDSLGSAARYPYGARCYLKCAALILGNIIVGDVVAVGIDYAKIGDGVRSRTYVDDFLFKTESQSVTFQKSSRGFSVGVFNGILVF